MKCLQCDAKMTSRRENYRYDSSGLSDVSLLGVDVRRCSTCGEYEVVIPRIEELHSRITCELFRESWRLTAAEILFLRKCLGWSEAEFEAHSSLGISHRVATATARPLQLRLKCDSSGWAVIH